MAWNLKCQTGRKWQIEEFAPWNSPNCSVQNVSEVADRRFYFLNFPNSSGQNVSKVADRRFYDTENGQVTDNIKSKGPCFKNYW